MRAGRSDAGLLAGAAVLGVAAAWLLVRGGAPVAPDVAGAGAVPGAAAPGANAANRPASVAPAAIVPGGGGPAADVAALEFVGETPLPDGRVERAYRVRLADIHGAHGATVVRLESAAPGIEVLRDTVRVPARAAGGMPPPSVDVLTLRQPRDATLRPGDWRWTLLPDPDGSDGLVPGPARMTWTPSVAVGAPPDPEPLVDDHRDR